MTTDYDRNHARLKAAFDRVKDPEHWKNPIDRLLPALSDAEIREITDAVIYFTGSVPTFTPHVRTRGVRVRAAGYFAAIGA